MSFRRVLERTIHRREKKIMCAGALLTFVLPKGIFPVVKVEH